MDNRISEIVERMKALEQELESELDKARENIRYRLIDRKVYFEHEALLFQRRFKVNLFRYALFPKPRHLLIAPFIYALFPALLLLDLMASLYHTVCFPLMRIPKVRRRDYMIFDRHQLAYLNLLEKLNCAYCSYGNGLMAWLSEVVARTEQYWCPIKHARRMLGTHERALRFLEFGDAERYHTDLEKIRRDFKD